MLGWESRSPVLSPGSKELGREAGPAAMAPPSWGSKHGLYVVVVDAGGTPKGREHSNPPVHMGQEDRLGAGMPRALRKNSG